MISLMSAQREAKQPGTGTHSSHVYAFKDWFHLFCCSISLEWNCSILWWSWFFPECCFFQGRVSDYTYSNLLSGSHMHNFAFGCSKKLFARTFLTDINAFSSSLPFHQVSQYLHILSTVMETLNSTKSKIHPTNSMAFAKHRWHGFIFYTQTWLDCFPCASTILCPVCFSENESASVAADPDSVAKQFKE